MTQITQKVARDKITVSDMNVILGYTALWERSGYGIKITQTSSTGPGLEIGRSTDGDSAVVHIHNDVSTETETVLHIDNAGIGKTMYIGKTNTGAGDVIFIDNAGTGVAVSIVQTGTVDTWGALTIAVQSLSTGLYINKTYTGGGAPMYINDQGTGSGSIRIYKTGTLGDGIHIVMGASSTGDGIDISNEEGATGVLCKLNQLSTTNSNPVLRIGNSGTGSAIYIAASGNYGTYTPVIYLKRTNGSGWSGGDGTAANILSVFGDGSSIDGWAHVFSQNNSNSVYPDWGNVLVYNYNSADSTQAMKIHHEGPGPCLTLQNENTSGHAFHFRGPGSIVSASSLGSVSHVIRITIQGLSGTYYIPVYSSYS